MLGEMISISVDYCLILAILWIQCFNCDVYPHRPKIKSLNGDLILEPGLNKNIQLKTNGPKSAIFLNDINLLDINQTKSKDISENGFTNIQADINRVYQRLELLETTTPGSNSYVNRSNFQESLNEINDRLVVLERKVVSGNIKNCNEYPCRHGGTCLDMMNRRHCLCPPQWEGDDCNQDVNECRNYAGSDLGCQNGATCINTPGSYECLCRTGWYGVHCTKRAKDCSGSNYETCGHGTCVTVTTGEGIKCICDQGWTNNGSLQCLTDIDECNPKFGVRCSTNPKVNCINLPGTFWCGPCPTGYEGDGYVCSDIDECLNGNNGGCSVSPRVSCHNTIGSRICGICPHGYEGDGTECKWRGSCNINNGDCYPSAQCIDNTALGTTQCICPDGMAGDGFGITGCFIPGNANTTGHCNNKPCGVHGTCRLVGTGFTCICHRGYSGLHCEIQQNYCDNNPCLNGGTCYPDVTKTRGFRCECSSQFSGDYCQSHSKSCGGVLEAEEGSLAYPNNNYSYSHNSRCAWVIHTSFDKVINVTFTKFNLEEETDCSYDFLQIHDGRSAAAQLIDRFCGNKFPTNGNIISSHNYLYLWFRSDATVAKEGFALHWTSIKPLCGGRVNATTHGQISSPGSPGKYPPNRDCFWHLTTTLGKRIQILFFSLDIEIHQNCSYDHISIYDGEFVTDPLLSKLCNSTLPLPIKSAGSNLLIHFHSDGYGSGKGFQITFAPIEGVPGCGGYYTDDKGEIISPSYNGKYLNRVLCEYKIKTSINTIIKITFNSFNIEMSSLCRFDHLKIYDGPSPDSRLVGTFCGKNVPKPFLSSSNSLYIIFKSDESVSTEGFKITFQAYCQQQFIGDSGVIKSQGYPFRYPPNKMCEYVIVTDPGKAIQLAFQDFQLEDNRYFQCRYDYLEIRDGSNGNSTLMGKFCGHSLPPIQISTHNYMYIKFNSDNTVGAAGFYANYTTINQTCGGIYRNISGHINFPSDENRYDNDQTCTWVLQAPPGMYIKIIWNRFSIEDSNRCLYDYLEIFEVDLINNQNSLGRFCGKKAPPAFTSTTNEIILKFTSDVNVQSVGFALSYTFLDDRSCGGTYINQHGRIYSPGWPKQYQTKCDCTWIIQVPKGQQIRLNISDFDLERSIAHSCNYGDYLEVRNGAMGTSPLIGKYCGSFQSKIIKSMTNTLYLRFYSDITITGKGFQIEWDGTVTGCGGTLTSSSGSITSPNYPANYYNNAECFYKVVVNPGSQIKFTFTDLDLEDTEDCKDDYVEIFDGRDETGLFLGRYCLMSLINPNTTIKTSSNQAFIKFRSDIFFASKGFWLNYEPACNWTLTGSYGVIESPNFPSYYESGLSCLWTIQVPKGNKINITFTHFDIYKQFRYYTPFHSSYTSFARPNSIFFGMNPRTRYIPACLDYLQIKEKSDLNFTQKLCGNVLPPAISSSTESLQIQFITRTNFISKGFRLEWVRYGCGGTIQRSYGTLNENISSEQLIECEWIIKTDVGSSIGITFTKLYMFDSPDCTTDAIEVFNGQDSNSPRIAKFCHDDISTFHSTSNVMLVKFIKQSSLKDAHFKSNFDSHPSTCGGWIQALSGTIQSKNYPKNYDNNLNCNWKLQVSANHKIELNFEDLDLYSSPDYGSNDTDCNDSIRVSDNQKVWPRICPNSNITLLSSRNNILNVQFVSDSFGNAKGFKANFSISCGAMITGQSEGIITSDTFDKHSNKSCVWIIVAPNTDEKIAITITHLSITKAHNNIATNRKCPTAYLKIYDGNDINGPLIEEYCGKIIPPMIVSQGSAVTLELGTYVSGIPKGLFSAHYTTLSNACGGALSSEEGYIASPKFPLSYPTNIDCEWTLRTSPGNKVYVTFENFDLENSEHCDEDYLEIRENDGVGRIVGIYCGNEIPVNSTTASKLYLKFHSNGKAPGNGFLLRYGFIHGNDIYVSQNGRIASPMYPYKFEGSGEYSWRLFANGTNTIDIRIDELEIISFGSSCYNSLIIYDGYDEDAPILDQLCGAITRDTKSFKSTSNFILIKLKLDDSNTGSIFILSYSQSGPVNKLSETEKNNCGFNETVTVAPETTFTFNSTKYPENYDNNLNCQWVFSATPGWHLTLKFIDFKLEETPNCFADHITIYAAYNNDPTEWKNVMDKFCLAIKVENQISPPNAAKLKVVFKTDSSVTEKGFTASVRSNCGGYITGLSGSFGVTQTSRVSYAETCEWTVKVRPGRTIKLTFEYFNITNIHNCDTFVVIKNGDSNDSPMLGNGKYCGYQHENRNDLATSSNALFVRYEARYLLEGFRLRYEENNIECGLTSTLDENNKWEIIKSPNYPSVPPPYTECVWILSGPPGEILRVDFTDRFDIESDQDCTKEAVEIKDGPSSLFPIIGRYCGKKPSTIKTSNNQVHITFLTRLREPRNGFSANVSIDVCGGTLIANSGELTSPSFLELPEGTICEWNIIGPVGYVLKITPQYIHLPPSETTCGTKVIIEESTQATNNTPFTLEKFCNDRFNIIYKTLETSSNNISLKLFIGKKLPPGFHRYLLHNTGNTLGFKFNFSSSRPQCGETITTPEGFLTTPGYPRYTTVAFCEWSIVVPNKLRRVRLTVIDGDENKQTIRVLFSLMTTPTLLNKTFESVNNKLRIFVYPHQMMTHHRFKAHFDSDEPAICGGDLHQYSGELVSPAMLTNLSNQYICEWTLDISQPKENRLNYTYGSIFITGAVNSSSTKDNEKKCHFTNSKLSIRSNFYWNGPLFFRTVCHDFAFRMPFSNYQIKAIKRRNDISFHINWKLQPCGGVLYINEEPTNALENVPTSYNESLDCAWVITNKKRMEIILDGEFVLDCDDEYITIHLGLLATEPMTEKYCKDKIKESLPPVRSRYIYLQYHSKPKNDTKIKLMVKTLPYQCGGYLDKNDFYFTSPNYPKNYLDNQECTWEIHADAGFRISLKFIDRFAIEFAPNCTKDAVIIYDWVEESWVEISRVCGRNLPSSFNSTLNQMKITFRSDNSTNLDGFKAKWISFCGGIYTANQNEQTMHSPGYPYYYLGRLNCVYEFKTHDDEQEIQFKFLDFDIEGPYPECKFSRVTLFSKENHLISSMCGKRPEMTYHAKTATLLFHSEGFKKLRRGFKLSFALYNCGGNITKPSEITIMSDSSNAYQNCTWYIQAPQSQIVTIKFLYISLDKTYECYSEYVAAFSDLQMNDNNRLALLCGYINSSTVIESPNNMMTLNYLSNLGDETHGFRARVLFRYSESVGCGGHIVLPSSGIQTLKSPLLNGSPVYENFLHCHWKVEAQAGQTIKIEFISFHIAPCNVVNKTMLDKKCDCDSVEIRDGLNPTSYLIGAYCGHDLPPITTTSSNKVSIQMLTDGEISSAGFELKLTSQPSLCGQSQIDVNGSYKHIKSPGYDTNTDIPRGIHCLYHLIVAEYEVIHLKIREMDLKPGFPDPFKCNKDKLTITFNNYNRNFTYGKELKIDGERDDMLLLHSYLGYAELSNIPERFEYCGKKQGIDMYLHSSATISLQTVPETDLNNYKGIDIEFKQVGVCEQNRTDPQGRINVNSNYNDDHIHCVVLITAPENNTISLHFLQVSLNSWRENTIYLDIFDGNTTTSNKLIRIGDDYDDNDPVFSTSRYILLLLSGVNSGYDLNYLTTDRGRGCGGSLNSIIGKISSPLYPEVYRHKGSCEWQLETPNLTRLRLHFLVFDLGRLCDQNYLQILDRDGVVVSTYCSEMPADYTMQDNYAKIVFTTTRNNGGSGWVLEFVGVA